MLAPLHRPDHLQIVSVEITLKILNLVDDRRLADLYNAAQRQRLLDQLLDIVGRLIPLTYLVRRRLGSKLPDDDVVRQLTDNRLDLAALQPAIADARIVEMDRHMGVLHGPG